MRDHTNQTDLLLEQFQVGDRIEISPALDRWMAGDRFGTVTKLGLRYLRVDMDASGQNIAVMPEHVQRKVGEANRASA
jgi:ribosomal protein L21E